MSFDLDLAIVYACALVLFYWLAAWFVPVVARAVLSALHAWWTRLRARWSGGAPASALPHHLPDVHVRALF